MTTDAMTTGQAQAPRVAKAAVEAALAELNGLVVDTEPLRVQRRSRDFHWFSPLLREQLDHVTADAIVSPADEDELKRVLAACYAHDVPVTVRGAGTATSGQAMPLQGGIVLDMGYLNRVLAIEPGWCRAGAGCVMGVLDHALRERGQALRVHPTTVASATVGGFVASGGAGVGSITWGTSSEVGAIRAVRVVTMEAKPRTLELRGSHVRLALQSWGTAGVITEVELPTAPLTRWLERVLGFATLEAALRFADRLAHADAILKRLVSVVAAPAPGRFLFPHGVDEATHVVLVMVAETAGEALTELITEHGGEALSVAGSPLYDYAWQHTTLHAAKHDRGWTYLQVAYAGSDPVLEVLATAAALTPDEVIPHVEFLRMGGRVACTGFPLVRFTTDLRLAELMAAHEAAGGVVHNPHVSTLEDVGPGWGGKAKRAFKREVDPKNLLNPGKLRNAV